MLDIRHPNEQNTYPVAVRLTHNRQRQYVIFGEWLTKDEFENIMLATRGKNVEKRKKYVDFFEKMYSIGVDLIDKNQFTLQLLISKVKYGKAVANKFNFQGYEIIIP